MEKYLKKINNQNNTLIVINHLHKKGEQNFTNIVSQLNGTNQTTRRVLDLLIEIGLIKERIISGAPTKYYSLTDKGVRIAQNLNEIEKILNE